MAIHEYQANEALNVQLGQAGMQYITNETRSLSTEHYVAIQALSVDCIISTVSADTDIWDSLSSITVLAGQTIYGRWKSVTIANGDFAMVYRG